MAVLVTGVGYIGSRLIKDLLDEGAEVVAVENYFSTDRRAVEELCSRPRFHLIRGNVGRADILKQAFESFSPIEIVYSTAAQASARPGAASPRYTENSNLLAPRLLLDAMVQHRVPTLVFASSFRVYGDDLPEVVSEDLPYGRFGDLSHLSKCYVEKLMEMYATKHGLRCLSVRLGVVYGLAPVMKKDYRFMTAPNKFCLQAVRREKISVYGSGLKPTGFIHVSDASRAMRVTAKCKGFGSYAAVNAVTEVVPVSAVAEIVANEGKRKGIDVEIAIESGQGTIESGIRVQSKLDAAGFGAERCLQDGVAEMLDYFLSASGRQGKEEVSRSGYRRSTVAVTLSRSEGPGVT